MTMVCKVCSHPERLLIDRALAGGGNVSKIAKKYSVSHGSLYHHRKNQLTRQMIKHTELREIVSGEHLIGVVTDLLSASQDILNKTKDNPKKYGVALKAIAESRQTVSLLWETAFRLQEYRAEDHIEGEYEKQWKKFLDDVAQLPVEDIETIRSLHEKAIMLRRQKSDQGRRTDLERKKSGPKKGWNHPQSYRTTIELKQRKRRRRKPAPVKVNEFDEMRDHLGMDNNPKPKRKRTGWAGATLF